MKQHEILTVKPLLDAKGNLTERGYAKHQLPIYRRAEVKASKLRIKEWDYYLITNDRFALALTVADNGYMGLASISLIDFETRWEKTVSRMSLLPLGKTDMPASSAAGETILSRKNYCIMFNKTEAGRELSFQMEDFSDGKPISGKLMLTDAPEETIVVCTPFEKRRHFFFNQKINCMRAAGVAKLGDCEYRFAPENAFAVLDWGRGVWTYHNTWYWGSASGLVNGVPFGFNLGYGFGDTSAASENMLFYNGKAHKLSLVDFGIPMKDGKEDYLSLWNFTSDDGRFEMQFRPILDRASCTNLLLLKSDQHQVFGRYTGTAVLDDGTTLKLQDFIGFAEKVENKW